jgi:FtsP/CotA-like multicopper oxidase with cupredoxin domain
MHADTSIAGTGATGHVGHHVVDLLEARGQDWQGSDEQRARWARASAALSADQVAVVVGCHWGGDRPGGRGVAAYARFTAPMDTVGKVEFEQRLAIPPLAESEVDGAGRRVSDLTAQAGRSVLLPGTESDTWGFNGRLVGPTLRAERGEHVRVNIVQVTAGEQP